MYQERDALADVPYIISISKGGTSKRDTPRPCDLLMYAEQRLRRARHAAFETGRKGACHSPCNSRSSYENTRNSGNPQNTTRLTFPLTET